MSSTVASDADFVDDDQTSLSRRAFLRRSAVLAVGVGLAACDSGGSDMDDETQVAETFSVTVEEIDDSYPYSDQNGVGVAYAIDGEVGGEITLQRGNTYEFELASSVESGPNDFPHPFYIDRTAEGGGADPFDEGVENAGALTGTVTFTVPSGAPDTLFYQCGNHAYMGGQMSIEGSA